MDHRLEARAGFGTIASMGDQYWTKLAPRSPRIDLGAKYSIHIF
jgi:hypothetical protein